jgi:hypothetical protein
MRLIAGKAPERFEIHEDKLWAKFDTICIVRHPEAGVVAQFQLNGEVVNNISLGDFQFEGEITINELRAAMPITMEQANGQA